MRSSLTTTLHQITKNISRTPYHLPSHHTRTMTTATFRYLQPGTFDPHAPSFPAKPWTKVDGGGSSFDLGPHERHVTDLRTIPSSSIGPDISGFGFYHSPATEKEFTNDETIRKGYYAEVEALLRSKLPGVKKVVLFDHTIRRRQKDSPRQPVQQVHVDQTPQAAEVRVRRHVPADEAEELLKGRYQIINIWRPIGHAATDFPLAVVDWRTMAAEDLIRVDLLYPKRDPADDGDDRGKETLPPTVSKTNTDGYEVKGETYGVRPNEKHKLYYVKDMTPEEALFLKIYDSRGQGQPGGKEGLAVTSAHTAFEDPATPKEAKGRQSIEVRALVFYE